MYPYGFLSSKVLKCYMLLYYIAMCHTGLHLILTISLINGQVIMEVRKLNSKQTLMKVKNSGATTKM